MFQTNNQELLSNFVKGVAFRLFFYILLPTIVAIMCIGVFPGGKVQAKKISHYSYDKIKNNLPEKYHTDEYLFNSNNIPYICFATYNGNNYKTSIKKPNGDNGYLYCVNYSKHIDFGDSYSVKNDLFNNNLRARLGAAFHYGPSDWKEKAGAQFTTGNSIMDYYMTQLVVHSLIYKYGGGKSGYGIDFSKVKFKSNTGDLEKKTKAFYDFCCNITVKDTDFLSYDLFFEKPQATKLFLEGEYLVSPYVKCQSNIDISAIESFSRYPDVTDSPLSAEQIIIESDGDQYNSKFRIKIPISAVGQLGSDVYNFNVTQEVNYKRYRAFFWICDESQEVGGRLIEDGDIKEKIPFSFEISDITLRKRDSVTKENVIGAEFQLLQYSDSQNDYIPYKNFSYDSEKALYFVNGIIPYVDNSQKNFKIIESKPAPNYINDWAGTTFKLMDNLQLFTFDVENQPILGKLHIYKTGEKYSFNGQEFVLQEDIPLPNVSFGLYAKEDIYLKGEVAYPKDQKIADLITDANGVATAENLLYGKYYFKEEATQSIYDLDPDIYEFDIVKDRQDNEVSFAIKNNLKKCNVSVFKYYSNPQTGNEEKIPLKGAQFGLYALEDVMGADNQVIIAKDCLITEGVSSEDGFCHFAAELPLGNYYIKELEAPEDYILNDGIVTISEEDFQKDTATGEYQAVKDIVNEQQRFQIQIVKYGETLNGFTRVNSDFGEYAVYQMGEATLKDVEFTLYDENNSIAAISKTNEEGVAQFNDLKPGTYHALETSSPEQYLMNPEKITFVCKANSKDYDPSNPPILKSSVRNQLFSTALSVYKQGERFTCSKNAIQYTLAPLEGVVFGVYQGFDYRFASAEMLTKNTCVGYIVTDKNGRGHLSAKLPEGSYYIKELRTNAGYVLDNNLYPFEVKAQQNNDIQINLGESNELINQLAKASVRIIKTDVETGKALKNVEFTLYNSADKKIGVYKTDKKGTILVEDLPYGSYYFIETKCKDGYYSSNGKYNFTLKSQETVTLNITNTPILKLGFEEHYKLGLAICLGLIICFCLILFAGRGRKSIAENTGREKNRNDDYV